MDPSPKQFADQLPTFRAEIDSTLKEDHPDNFGRLRWWAKWLWVYNMILFLEVLLTVPYIFRDGGPGLMFYLISYAFLANIYYCAGIVFNCCLWRFGHHGMGISRIILAGGTLLAMLLTVLVLIRLSQHIPAV